jgi:hypothetical protein
MSCPRPDWISAAVNWKNAFNLRAGSRRSCESAHQTWAMDFVHDQLAIGRKLRVLTTPGVLPELWKGDTITVADAIGYFAASHTVMVKRDGYDEPVVIPVCSAAAIEAAIGDAVRQRLLWLLNGPTSFQGEPVPAGVLTASAQLRAPMAPLQLDQLMQDSVPEAWKDGHTTALALSVALSTKTGRPVPWTVLRRAIEDAIKVRWIELAANSGPWPCEMAAASTVTMRQPISSGGFHQIASTSGPKGLHTYSAQLEPAMLQDLVDILPDLIKAAVGVPLRFQLQISLGDGEDTRMPGRDHSWSARKGDARPDRVAAPSSDLRRCKIHYMPSLATAQPSP